MKPIIEKWLSLPTTAQWISGFLLAFLLLESIDFILMTIIWIVLLLVFLIVVFLFILYGFYKYVGPTPTLPLSLEKNALLSEHDEGSASPLEKIFDVVIEKAVKTFANRSMINQQRKEIQTNVIESQLKSFGLDSYLVNHRLFLNFLKC
jgi:hypothetical protein